MAYYNPKSIHIKLFSHYNFNSFSLLLNIITRIKVLVLNSHFLLLTCLVSCLSEPDDEFLRLKVEETSCTEVWLSVYGQSGSDINLQRDGNAVMEFTLNKPDTTVLDTGLTPNTTYSYQASNGSETAGPVTITTMDTTSHDFTWQVYDFGGEAGYGSSSFSDVSIINESDIWVTGDISTAEGNFNAAHWDGIEWTLMKITVNFRDNLISPPLEGVFSFISSDIWFAGSLPIRFNDNNWIIYDVRTTVDPNLSLSKIWGRNSRDIFFVGRGGSIAYYHGQNWVKIESGTTENIQDIWGADDTKTGKDFILCTASQIGRQSDNLVLKINDDNTVSNFNWPYKDQRVYSAWFRNERKIFLCGDGMVTLTGLKKWNSYDNLSNYFMFKVRGNDLNDVYTVGGYGYLAHFNGISWYELPSTFNGNYVSVDVKDNMAVAVGYTNRTARVMMLTRYVKS